MEGPAKEEEATTAGGKGWERDTGTETAWGTQESGKVELPGDAIAGGGNTGKDPFAAANKAGAQGRHGVRPANRERSRGQPENQSDKSSGVRGDDWGCEASGVARFTLEWVARRGVARPPEWLKIDGGTTREWVGESSCHRASTPPEW